MQLDCGNVESLWRANGGLFQNRILVQNPSQVKIITGKNGNQSITVILSPSPESMGSDQSGAAVFSCNGAVYQISGQSSTLTNPVAFIDPLRSIRLALGLERNSFALTN